MTTTTTTTAASAGSTTPDFVAVFPSVDRAVAWHERLTGNPEGNYATNIARKGRTVTWDILAPAGADLADLADTLRENVGYVGSDQRRRATLNGRSCPFCW